jgi:hypothetical protein
MPPSGRNAAKIQILRQQGVLNPHPQAVTDSLFQTGDFFDAHDLLQVKYEMFRRVDVDKADAFSFGEGIALTDGDIVEIAFEGFGRPLRNPIRFQPGEPAHKDIPCLAVRRVASATALRNWGEILRMVRFA